MNKTKTIIIALAVAFVAVVVAATCGEVVLGGKYEETYAESIYDKIGPEMIKLYEDEIAGEPIVSGISAANIARTAERLNIEQSKLRVLYVVQDIAVRVGKRISLDELAAMTDIAVFIYAKNCGEEYAKSLSPERREQLKQLFLAALKK